jgi:uncharacterized membrane protein (DUF2068 family)
MDQNTPRDEATGAQPPVDAGSSDASAWNQAPAPDQSQPAAGGNQEAAAEYAAWSADTSYQQQAPQPAQQADTQAYAAPPQQQADTQAYAAAPQQQPDAQAYAAPPPQSATYSEQPAAQQAYQQPQQGYDPNAYGQQQGYQQPQQGYQQPQYYDPNAYGQQPGYYDQNAYQQQYAQQGYQQPAPYGYAQPGQEQWIGEAEVGGYNRSFLAVLSAWVLLTWGLVWGFSGALVLYFQGLTDWLPDVTFSADVNQLIDDVESAQERIVAFGGILLIIGIVQVIAAVGVFGHRRWGRAFAIVISILGILGALGIFTVSAGFEAMDVGLDEAIKGEEGSIAASVIVLASYLIVFLGMTVGRRHFRKRGVEA